MCTLESGQRYLQTAVKLPRLRGRAGLSFSVCTDQLNSRLIDAELLSIVVDTLSLTWVLTGLMLAVA